jgi:hypothetical protein
LCQILDHAFFDATFPISACNWSMAEVNLDAAPFINTDDAKAYAIYSLIDVSHTKA